MQGVFIFLKKLLGVKIPKEADLNQLRIIRNCIAHANGLLADYERPEQVTKAIRRQKGIGIDSEGYVDVTAVFCEQCLQAVKSFFEDTFTQLGFGPSANRGPSQQATRYGVSVEHRNGKWVYEILGEADVEKLKRTKIE